MKLQRIKKYCLILMFLVSSLQVLAQSIADRNQIIAQSNVNDLNRIKSEGNVAYQSTLSQAQSRNIPINFSQNGILYSLSFFDSNGNPVYVTTSNESAAVSTQTNQLKTGGELGLNLSGQGLVCYVWEANGVPRLTHQEFDGPGGQNRVSNGDTFTSVSNHATHVAGTICAYGFQNSAQGMAPNALIEVFESGNHLSEVADSVLKGALISNHSYAYGTGVNPLFYGGYTGGEVPFDEVLFDAPYYLLVTAAGNLGRKDPLSGETPTANTNPIDPTKPQYDKIAGLGMLKNGLTVANAQDVQYDTSGNPISIIITNTSSQGPADDLRIKPDVTGNGYFVNSSVAFVPLSNPLIASNNSYDSYTGTSMSAPNVSGSLLLLQEHYRNLNPFYMRSSTLKGLALHTATDAGMTGPDAIFGWGLLNARFAAETISNVGINSKIEENTLMNGQTYSITVNSDGLNPLKASISWTDPAGPLHTITNNTAPMLVNDLDLRVVKNTTTFMPWRLTAVDANATADNNRDPFERVDVENASGSYTITVTHKGTLPANGQRYSLIVTGISNCQSDLAIVDPVNISTTYNVINTITANSTIGQNLDVNYLGNQIILQDGFYTTGTTTGEFLAAVENCEQATAFRQPVYVAESVESVNNTIDDQNDIFNIYPNPASDSFRIDFSKKVKGIVRIYNLKGQLVLSSPINETNKEINLYNQKSGIYLVTIATDDGIVATKKLIKN